MGSRLGYSYSYRFSSADLNDVKSVMKSCYLSEGVRVFIFEIRTNFIIVERNTEEEGVACKTMGSERHDVNAVLATFDAADLAFYVSERLEEYWMSEDEINLFCEEAIAFAREIAARDPSLNRIPIVVHLDVCTVQQEGESFDATQCRAITMHKLSPLYLWPFQTVVNKPMTMELKDFLALLPRVRVEDTDKVSTTLMRACPLCLGRPCIGDLITKLSCHCAFHSHCIVRKLEYDNLCPRCRRPAYDRSFLDCPFYEFDYPNPQ